MFVGIQAAACAVAKDLGPQRFRRLLHNNPFHAPTKIVLDCCHRSDDDRIQAYQHLLENICQEQSAAHQGNGNGMRHSLLLVASACNGQREFASSSLYLQEDNCKICVHSRWNNLLSLELRNCKRDKTKEKFCIRTLPLRF
jgi:hypothetical protein